MTHSPVAIYADFSNSDPKGRLRLNLYGTQKDLDARGLELSEGRRLVLSDGELRVPAVAHFSNEEGIWVAEIRWSEVTDADDKTEE